MSDHWQNGPPGPPHDPSYGHGRGDSTGGYTSPAGQWTGGYGAPEEGYGPPPAPSREPNPYAPGPYASHPYGPGAYPPGPYGAPPPPYPDPRFLPIHPYFVEPPDRTSAIVALIISLVLLFTCLNPLAIGGLIFSAVSMSEPQDHNRAARHARNAWYCVGGGLAIMVLFFLFFWGLIAFA